MTTEPKKMVYSDPWLDFGRDLMQLVFLNDGGQSNVHLYLYKTNLGSSGIRLHIFKDNFRVFLMQFDGGPIYEMGEYDELDREMKWLVINAREAYKAYEKARDDEVLRRVGSLPLEKKNKETQC
jgi:hypothetical protein